MMGSARLALCRRSPSAGDIRHDGRLRLELGEVSTGVRWVSRGALELVTPFLPHRPETSGSGRVPGGASPTPYTRRKAPKVQRQGTDERSAPCEESYVPGASAPSVSVLRC